MPETREVPPRGPHRLARSALVGRAKAGIPLLSWIGTLGEAIDRMNGRVR
jgi:hypothetical protein